MIVFRRTAEKINGSVMGKPFSLPYTEETYNALADMRASGEYDVESILNLEKESRFTSVATACEYITFNPKTEEFFLSLDGATYANPVPTGLAKKLVEAYDKEIDMMPVIKATVRILSNPRYTPEMGELFGEYITSTTVDKKAYNENLEAGMSEDAAKAAATYDDISITQEGLLATYKVVNLSESLWALEERESPEGGTYQEKVRVARYPHTTIIDPNTGDVTVGGPEYPDNVEDLVFEPSIIDRDYGHDFFCGEELSYIYQVGKQALLPEEAPRNLRNTFGGGGLYSGGLTYIDTYSNDGNYTLVCLVNPSDILSFQSEGSALRTNALFPYGVWDFESLQRGSYHSADYDTMSSERISAEIEALNKAAVEIAQEMREEASIKIYK